MSISGNVVGEYAYDAFGRRTKKGSPKNVVENKTRYAEAQSGESEKPLLQQDYPKKIASGTTTLYHYDSAGKLIAETDGNGTPQRDYIYLYGEPLALKLYGSQAGMFWFINDHLGTPQKIVNNSGQVVWAAAYLPFGKAQVNPETVTNNLRFPGQYYDAESGLHYNWHRYYDPDTGRYITADPIGLSGGINLYTYVMGNPVNSSDPMGLVDYDVDSQGFHFRLDTKSNVTVRVSFDADGNYVLSDKAGHPLSKEQMKLAEKKYAELIGDRLQQQKMRDAVAKKFGCYKNEAFIRDIGRNLRRTIGRIGRTGGNLLGVAGIIIQIADFNDLQKRAESNGIGIGDQMITDMYEGAGYVVIYPNDPL